MTEMPVFDLEYIKVYLNKEESNSPHDRTSDPRSAGGGRQPRVAPLPANAGIPRLSGSRARRE